MRISTSTEELRVLDFDVECRPLAFYGDFVTKQPTAIAWSYIGEHKGITVKAIGESDRSSKVPQEEREMLEAFIEAYNAADLVTGHFIRGFDLPLLNGALGMSRDGCVTGASSRNWDGYGNDVAFGPAIGAGERGVLTDPQTSGGLLVACAAQSVDAVLDVFRREGFGAATSIGQFTAGAVRINIS